jgi:hypothetical protein
LLAAQGVAIVPHPATPDTAIQRYFVDEAVFVFIDIRRQAGGDLRRQARASDVHAARRDIVAAEADIEKPVNVRWRKRGHRLRRRLHSEICGECRACNKRCDHGSDASCDIFFECHWMSPFGRDIAPNKEPSRPD